MSMARDFDWKPLALVPALALLVLPFIGSPSTWRIETDRGEIDFVLKSEEDIRRLEEGRLLITSTHGVQLQVPDRWALDKASKRVLERFL